MSGDEKAYFLYLLVLLVFIAGGFLFSRRRKLNQTLQQAAIWGLIFAGVVIAYGFSDTLQGQLFGSKAVESEDGGYTLKRQSDGHFYLTLSVNDTPVTFLVDTGATQIVLTRQDALKVGLDTNDLIFSGRANTANGTVKTAFVVLDDITLGSHTDEDVRAAVNGGDMQGSLLGMTYLSRFEEVTFRGDTLVLRR